MGQGRHTLRSISDPVYPRVYYHRTGIITRPPDRSKMFVIQSFIVTKYF